MMKPAAILSLLFFAPFCLAAQVGNGPLQATSSAGTDVLYAGGEIKGDDVLALPGRPGAWLLTSASQGLMLVDESGLSHVLQGDNVEALDARGNVTLGGKTATLVSAIEGESGDVVLFSLNEARQLQELSRIKSTSALPETQCLYRAAEDGHISLFVVDARGMIEQRIVYDGQTSSMVDIPVRAFVGVTDAEACAVDDNTGSLYVAEETLGVWRYAAAAETDATRRVAALREPHGAVRGDIADIAIASTGELWVLAAEPAVVHRYVENSLVESVVLPDVVEAKSLAVARGDNSVAMAIYVEDSDSYRQAKVASPSTVFASRQTALPAIYPDAQTQAVARFGDAADDPAIWINERRPAQSLIIGTDKREGLKVYSLKGEMRQSLDIGRLNNVDLIAEASINGKGLPLVAASNRTLNSISLFTIEGRARVVHLGEIPTNLSEVYGLCMYQSETGNYVFVNDTDGRYQQYRIDTSAKTPKGELVREFRLPSQPEGCAVDRAAKTIYMGEEKAGIWKTGAEPDAAPLELIIKVGDALVADVEGMDIYVGAERNYLVVSSQGSDSYVVYGLGGDYPQLGQFRIAANLARGIDGVSETDGLAVTSSPLPGYPQGLLVVQDGRNRMPDQPQNFKLVSWEQVLSLIGHGVDGAGKSDNP